MPSRRSRRSGHAAWRCTQHNSAPGKSNSWRTAGFRRPLSAAPRRSMNYGTRSRASEITRDILHELQYVGVLCVEFFVDTGGELLVNEIAPRPHNSGHLTFDAAVTSQFEQQVRAICALPLGSTKLLTPAAAMANLLGELWEDGEPNWAAASRFSDVKLHLYGKSEA